MKLPKLSKLSKHSLRELSDLISRMDGLIKKDYSHISDSLCPKITKAMQSQYDKIEAELSNR